MTVGPWRKVDESRIKGGYRKVLRRTYELPDGTRQEFEVKEEPDGAAIVALTQGGEVLLVRQYRVGPEAVVDELPGGYIDPEEAPEVAAVRELLEETGHRAASIEYIGSSLDCAYSTRRRHHFLATGCVRVSESIGAGIEDLEVVPVTLTEFRERLRSGQLTDAGTGYRCLDAAGLL